MNEKDFHRRSVRLPGYDYTQPGAYFITLVTKNRECWLGKIADGQPVLSQFGVVVERELLRLEERFPYVTLDSFVIMPNHVHGVIVITEALEPNDDALASERQAQFGKQVAGSIPVIVRSFKSTVTLQVNQLRRTPGAQVWQSNYYEHVIRDVVEWIRIRQYMKANPSQWEQDQENPDGKSV